MNTNSCQVVTASWGAIDVSTNPETVKVFDITASLNSMLQVQSSIAFTVHNFGDPFPTKTKSFAGLVIINGGPPVPFACQEGATINFMSISTGATYEVQSAVFGGTDSNGLCKAYDVSSILQSILNDPLIQSNTGVQINSNTFGDPYLHCPKAFSAVVTINGIKKEYACTEGVQIFFN